jgi:hypothetical protein
MVSNVKKRFLAISLVLSFTIAITGCSNDAFVKRVVDFQSGVDTTTTAIGTYYSELNDFERDLYLQERLFDPSKDVLTIERDPNDPSKKIPTALVGQVFSAESIKARTDAIQLLGVYGRRLAELAGSDAPTRFAAGSQVLGDNLKNLSNTFGSLAGDPTAGKYIGPIGTLIGVIGQLILESKRDAALTKAVQEAAPLVRTIIDLLESDLNTVIGPQRLTGTKQALSEIIVRYNKPENRTTMNLEQRQQALEEIRRAQERYDIAVAFNPSDVMSSMREAHEALVKYATSSRKPQNLAELVSALEVFKERAEVIATAVLQLRSLRKGTL